MSHSYASRYATEEQDFSESDCQSDGQMCQHAPVPADVTEIYRRQHQIRQSVRSSPGTYYHTHSAMQGYYEDPNRSELSCGCNPQIDPRCCYYKINNNDATYRALPLQQQTIPRTCHDTVDAVSALNKTTAAPITTAKKYPVTARTPRYYRYFKSSGVPVCKRPSTLCLPVACQPDPGSVHQRRQRKSSTNPLPLQPPPETHQYRGQEGFYPINACCAAMTRRPGKSNNIASAVAATAENPHPIDSEGDVNTRFNDLENLLTKFGQDDDGDDNEIIDMATVTDLTKILKPKVPASIKAKQEKNANLKCTGSKASTSETVAVTAPTTVAQNMSTKLDVKEPTTVLSDEPFDVLLRRLSRENIGKSKEKSTTQPNNNTNTYLKLTNSTKRTGHFVEQKPPLDDNSALELHKSKSYIVSLIDKALSKELGTIPGEKCSRDEFLNMNPKRAIDLVNRHTISKIPEIDHGFNNKCECSKFVEEPHYMKQLKQLRWSHLKHIQREAKRLADLERFLESFRDNNDNST